MTLLEVLSVELDAQHATAGAFPNLSVAHIETAASLRICSQFAHRLRANMGHSALLNVTSLSRFRYAAAPNSTGRHQRRVFWEQEAGSSNLPTPTKNPRIWPSRQGCAPRQRVACATLVSFDPVVVGAAMERRSDAQTNLRGLACRGEYAAFNRPNHRIGSTLGIHLAVDVLQVPLDRMRAQGKLLSDLLVP